MSRKGENRGGDSRGQQTDDHEQPFHGYAIHGSTTVIKKESAGRRYGFQPGRCNLPTMSMNQASLRSRSKPSHVPREQYEQRIPLVQRPLRDRNRIVHVSDAAAAAASIDGWTYSRALRTSISFDELHREEVDALGLFHRMECDDVRVVQRGDGTGFALEARGDRDRAPSRRVGP